MRKSSAAVLAVLLAAACIGCLADSPPPQQSATAQPPAPQTWEYMAITHVGSPPHGPFLVGEGMDGWEVFQVVHGSEEKAVHYYLKRPKG